ncbi:exodeoxyribonuclease V subunit beta [Pasteurellaceae bacterium 22721_9_1]
MSEFASLNYVTTPLIHTSLIEASAGTGKTYTMASLYIRLLLQAGENNFPRALTVNEILVVTFTEASTQELKERIRERIHLCKQQLEQYCQQRAQITKDNKEQMIKAIFADNQPLIDLLDYIDDLDIAIQRLRLAEQNIDLASIYTIHGFCRRVLMQYAFHSGIHFELELTKDENQLLQQLSNQFWREQFYPTSYLSTYFIHQYLQSPSKMLSNVQSFLKGDLPKVSINEPHLLTPTLSEFLTTYLDPELQKIIDLKQIWLEKVEEVTGLLREELYKRYRSKGDNTPSQWRWFELAIRKINEWANDTYQIKLPEGLTKYFSQQRFDTYDLVEGAEPLSHPVFSLVDEVQQINFSLYKNVVLYHYIQWLTTRLNEYKQDHKEKSFDDLLRLLRDALMSTQGDELAQRIRSQYPFAMIDEFQDTDSRQYQIFKKIYQHQSDTGFIMIGDPKQAIYKFRGADIFTYLNASKQAKRFTLERNYRSTEPLVRAINHLFNFTPKPFLYSEIEFLPVEAFRSQTRFSFQGKKQPAMIFHIGDRQKTSKKGDITLLGTETKQLFADTCANSIAEWLQTSSCGEQSAVENTAVFEKGEKTTPVKDNDIAVLVQSWHEAMLIKLALADRGIASVYLSDRSNVFDTDEAQELSYILAACLNPTNISAILNALATSIFALTQKEIQQIKLDDHLLDRWVTRFEYYQKSWLNQGVLAMLYQLFLAKDQHQRCILDKIRSMQDGERRVTDLLHLAELLQQAAPLNETEASLLRWFELQIQNQEAREDEQQQRLESENERVKIITIHKSKGLQYPLVWLPFLAFSNPHKSDFATYYDATTEQRYWNIDGTQNELSLDEEKAEKIRLLYVALTRAEEQVNITLPTFFSEKWSSIWYVLSRGKIEPDQVDNTLELLNSLTQNGLDVVVKEIEEQQFTYIEYQSIEATEKLQAATFTGNIEMNWQLSSFTGLIRNHENNLHKQQSQSAVQNLAVFDLAKDQDQTLIPLKNEANLLDREDGWEDYPEQYRPVDFPQGSYVGTLLHHFLEKQPFNQAINAENIAKLCQQLQLDENWQAPLHQWIEQILHTPLLADNDLSLAQLQPKHCLKEMQFYFNLHRTFKAETFNRILKQHHKLASQPLNIDDIQGMLRGFIDLVFEHQGKYYIVDYKSNFLGKNKQAYHRDELNKVMENHHYDIQYLLYCLALNRYLGSRLPDYQYETHFGGVIYTFLRGMNGQNTDYGLFFDRPSYQLINELEGLFNA